MALVCEIFSATHLKAAPQDYIQRAIIRNTESAGFVAFHEWVMRLMQFYESSECTVKLQWSHHRAATGRRSFKPSVHPKAPKSHVLSFVWLS
jgi:hypothetical protein